ncbi:DUF4286 family protein [Weeksellaceae bacterium A-14]|uniref:DUF4286 family protein n=1 Tax=Daejeonia sp. YH14 TaxID=3439042 RepID=UPI0031E4CB6C
MSILSLTFHCPETHLDEWEKYVDETLALMADNLMDADMYVLSEVASDMVSEGKNFNLLLVFPSDEARGFFLENELLNIQERIEKQFGENIMIFKTFLNPIKFRLE